MAQRKTIDRISVDLTRDPIPFELREFQKAHPTWWVILFVAVAFFTVSLFTDLGADSLLGPFAVEGQWLLEARQLATGETIPLDDWRPGLLAPSQTWLSAQAFKLFEPHIEVARALSGGVSLLCLGLFFLLAVRASGVQAAVWATLLLVSNPSYQAISRMALPIVFSLFWMLLTVWLWDRGRRNVAFAFLTGCLVIWAGLVENSPSSAFFVVSALVVMLFIRFHAIKMPWRPSTLTRLHGVGWGMAFAFVALWVVILTHWVPYGRMWDHFTVFNWRIVASSLFMAPITLSRTISQMPGTALLALVYFLFFAKLTVRPVARHRKTNEVRMWFLGWVLAGGVYMVFSSPRPEALALLVPPFCLLAGECLVRLFALRKISRPRIDVMIITLMIAGAVWFAVAWLVRLYYSVLPSAFWQEHHIRGTAILVGVLWPLLSWALVWLYLKWKKRALLLNSRFVTVLTLFLLAVSVTTGGGRIVSWYQDRPHHVQEASLKLTERVPSESFLVGLWAPLLTLGTPLRATMVWPEVNDRAAVWQRDVTHLLLVRERETRTYQPPLRTFAGQGMVPGERTLSLDLGLGPLDLYPLVKKAPSGP